MPVHTEDLDVIALWNQINGVAGAPAIVFGGGRSSPQYVGVINANAAPYNCTPNLSTFDNAPGINSAITAAANYAAANQNLGIIEFDPGEYYISGALQTTANGCYAQIPIPDRASSSPKLGLVLRARNRATTPQPYPSQFGGVQTGNVIFRSTLTGQSYSATYGMPSIMGGPDTIGAGGLGSGFTNFCVVLDGISFRQAPNPTLCCVNFQRVMQCIIQDARCDTTENTSGVLTQPTNPTGIAVLMPQAANNGISSYRNSCWAIGYYGGLGINEHVQADHLVAYRCYVGLNIQDVYDHCAHINHANVEHCNYTVATLLIRPAATGVTTPNGYHAGFCPFDIDLLDIEDAGDSSWATTVAHIADWGNRYVGRIAFLRVTGGVGTGTGLTNWGARNVITTDLGATTRNLGLVTVDSSSNAWVAPLFAGQSSGALPTSGASPWAGFGNAMTFDGVNRGDDTMGIFIGTIGVAGAFCVEARVAISNFTNAQAVVAKFSAVAAQNNFFLGINNVAGQLLGAVVNSGGTEVDLAGGALSTGNHVIALTYDGTTVRLFGDGAVVASAAVSGLRAPDIKTPTWIGRQHSIGGVNPNPFTGTVDEVRISNVVRYTTTYTPASTPFSSDANTTALYHLDSAAL